MPPNNQLARRQTQQLARSKAQPLTVRPVSSNAIAPQTQQPVIVYVQAQPQSPKTDEGYQLTKDRLPQTKPQPFFSSIWGGLFIGALFVFGIPLWIFGTGMLSIGLDSYAQSVQQRQRINRIIHVE